MTVIGVPLTERPISTSTSNGIVAGSIGTIGGRPGTCGATVGGGGTVVEVVLLVVDEVVVEVVVEVVLVEVVVLVVDGVVDVVVVVDGVVVVDVVVVDGVIATGVLVADEPGGTGSASSLAHAASASTARRNPRERVVASATSGVGVEQVGDRHRQAARRRHVQVLVGPVCIRIRERARR